jgi:hypothetical protein
MTPLLFLVPLAWAQVKTDSAAPSNSSPGLSSHVLLENENFRVEHLDLNGEIRATLPPRGTDTIIASLSTGVSLVSGKSDQQQPLEKGDVRFLRRSERATLVQSGSSASEVLLVDLKQHWDVDAVPCLETKACSHAIRIGTAEIGQSTSLFTKGFVTAYRDWMDPGGTLDTSYYSKSGTHHLLLIALDGLQADFDGSSQNLKRGQVYASDATQVEVEAGDHAVRWVMIRVETPKK